MQHGEQYSKPLAAKMLKISIDSLKDRIDGALKKLKAAFPEWTPVVKDSGNVWRSPDRLWDGLFYRSSAKHVASLYRIDPKTNERTEVMLPVRVTTRTPQRGFAEYKQWERVTNYQPYHDGIFSPIVNTIPSVPAHMRNAASLPKIRIAKTESSKRKRSITRKRQPLNLWLGRQDYEGFRVR